VLEPTQYLRGREHGIARALLRQLPHRASLRIVFDLAAFDLTAAAGGLRRRLSLDRLGRFGWGRFHGSFGKYSRFAVPASQPAKDNKG
jgi:hypothetical protein